MFTSYGIYANALSDWNRTITVGLAGSSDSLNVKLHTMDSKQLEQFHQELADLGAKYGLSGLVGVWFERRDKNMRHGFIKAYDAVDTVCKILAEGTYEKLRQLFAHIAPVTDCVIVKRGSGSSADHKN